MFALINSIALTRDAVIVSCEKAIVSDLLDKCEQCAAFALQLGKAWFRIMDGQKVWDVPASFAIMSQNKGMQEGAIATLQKLSSFDLTEFYSREQPSYLIAVPSQKLLACNEAALIANDKTAQEYIGQSVMGLWDDNKLMKLSSYLKNARHNLIDQYEFVGRRWRKEIVQEEILWRRDNWAFLSRYQLVNFMGQKCRYGVTLDAQKVSEVV